MQRENFETFVNAVVIVYLNSRAHTGVCVVYQFVLKSQPFGFPGDEVSGM